MTLSTKPDSDDKGAALAQRILQELQQAQTMLFRAERLVMNAHYFMPVDMRKDAFAINDKLQSLREDIETMRAKIYSFYPTEDDEPEEKA